MQQRGRCRLEVRYVTGWFMKANNAEAPDSSNAADTLKWVATFVLLVAAVVGNYLYGELSVVA
ncbi:hypothetical protein VCV52_4022, partial [Vibrio cholerae V52]